MLSADSVKQERKNIPEVKYFLLFKELWILVRNNVEHLHEHFQRKNDVKASLVKYAPEVLFEETENCML